MESTATHMYIDGLEGLTDRGSQPSLYGLRNRGFFFRRAVCRVWVLSFTATCSAGVGVGLGLVM